MGFFRRYDPEELTRIRFRGAATSATDDKFLIRPEEAVGGVFLVLLVAMSLGHSRPIFEPLRDSRLTYLSAQFFVLVMVCVGLWTLVQRFHPRPGPGLRDEGGGGWKNIWRAARDWTPAIMILGVYESLKHLHLNEIILWLGNTPKDQVMIRVDLALFGGHASVWMQSLISEPMTVFMKIVYFVGYYVYPMVAGVFLYMFRPREAFRELVLAIFATTFIGYTLYILVPVAGPRFEIPHLYHTTFEMKWYLAQRMEQMRFDYDCFPSLHTALPLVVMMVAFRHSRWFGMVLLPFVLATVMSTLYLQMHYLIDVVAGIALVPICVWIGVRADGWWLRLTQLMRFDPGERVRSAVAVRVLKVLQVTVVVIAALWMTWRLV